MIDVIVTKISHSDTAVIHESGGEGERLSQQPNCINPIAHIIEAYLLAANFLDFIGFSELDQISYRHLTSFPSLIGYIHMKMEPLNLRTMSLRSA
ncbi:hypothetical protein J6590_001263 [Homalodisca vitripennis]|nr:hypothetical protein J6590_001263 [Homalodisca vitripennis]